MFSTSVFGIYRDEKVGMKKINDILSAVYLCLVDLERSTGKEALHWWSDNTTAQVDWTQPYAWENMIDACWGREWADQTVAPPHLPAHNDSTYTHSHSCCAPPPSAEVLDNDPFLCRAVPPSRAVPFQANRPPLPSRWAYFYQANRPPLS